VPPRRIPAALECLGHGVRPLLDRPAWARIKRGLSTCAMSMGCRLASDSSAAPEGTALAGKRTTS
jgi:hypothetical protein